MATTGVAKFTIGEICKEFLQKKDRAYDTVPFLMHEDNDNASWSSCCREWDFLIISGAE